jgi:hypothetical protein
MHRSAPVRIGQVNHFVITFSVIEDGVERVLPHRYQQATNAEFIQVKPNSDTPLSFDEMNKHAGDDLYKNTIRVWVKKNDGTYAETFMHPTFYPAKYLTGCMSTAPALDEDGSATIDYGAMPEGSDGPTEELNVTSGVLGDIYQLYNSELGIGDRSGNYDGNAFFMKTNSMVTPETMTKMATPEITPIPNTPNVPSINPPIGPRQEDGSF